MSWDVCKFVRYPYPNAERIFPLKQAAVEMAIEACKKNPRIQGLIVFGSTVRPDCNPWSDVDLYVVGGDRYADSLIISHPTQAFDIWYESDRKQMPDEKLFQEIDRTGVLVYSKGEDT